MKWIVGYLAVRCIAWLDLLLLRPRDFQLCDAIRRQRKSQIRYNVLMAPSHARRRTYPEIYPAPIPNIRPNSFWIFLTEVKTASIGSIPWHELRNSLVVDAFGILAHGHEAVWQDGHLRHNRHSGMLTPEMNRNSEHQLRDGAPGY